MTQFFCAQGAALEIARNIKMKQNFEKEREIFEKAIEITMIP